MCRSCSVSSVDVSVNSDESDPDYFPDVMEDGGSSSEGDTAYFTDFVHGLSVGRRRVVQGPCRGHGPAIGCVHCWTGTVILCCWCYECALLRGFFFRYIYS